MLFHWSLRDKSSQVSKTFLSILAVLSNAVIWIVFTRLPSLLRPFNNPLVIVTKAPITIIIIIFIIIISCELFLQALTDGFSLESEWLQV